MKIRNAVIITDDDTELRMSLAEAADFAGNIVFSRANLPADLGREIDRAVGRSRKVDAATTDHRGMAMKPEFVG